MASQKRVFARAGNLDDFVRVRIKKKYTFLAPKPSYLNPNGRSTWEHQVTNVANTPATRSIEQQDQQRAPRVVNYRTAKIATIASPKP
jgi:hypothetical protein